jgi:hypothetical protein
VSLSLIDMLALLDRPHTPPPGHPELARYKEWWHLNVIDEAHDLDLIVNLSLAGDLHIPGKGRAYGIVLAHRAKQGWAHDIILADGLVPQIERQALNLSLGTITLRPVESALRLAIADAPDRKVAAMLDFHPRTEPTMIWRNTPIGQGHINWLLVPSLDVSGWIDVAGQRYDVVNARGYHDHNWGHWQWGDNFGWDWGFAAAFHDFDGETLSLVYDRTTENRGERTIEHSLAVWAGSEMICFFARRHIHLHRRGTFAGLVRRIPGVAALIAPAQPCSVPAEIVITAREANNWMTARYCPDAAIQIGVPSEMGNGLIELNETFGSLEIAGSVAGRVFSTHRRACFEFVI